jgi:hypothetical protein
MFPTATEMPENVVWRRDIYREIDLNQDANAGLYYPVEPIDKQLNLFTYVFKLALNGYIPVYEYRLDGNEVFTDSAKVSTTITSSMRRTRANCVSTTATSPLLRLRCTI